MNRKQFLILLVVGLLVGGFTLSLVNRERASFKTSDTGSPEKVLPNFPLNDVAQVRITQGTNVLNLVRLEDMWKVKERNAYPANYAEVSDLLRKVWELKPNQEVKVGPSQLGRLDLLDPAKGTNNGTLLEFMDKGGKSLQSLLLGKKFVKDQGDSQPGGGFPSGRYVMVPNSTPPRVSLVTEAFASIEPKAEAWLNKDFFKVEKIKSVSVTTTNGQPAWQLSREKEGGELKLADLKEGEQLDAAKAGGPGSVFSFPSFTDVLPAGAKAETTGLDSATTARVETFEDFTYEIKFAKSPVLTEDQYCLTLKVEGTAPKARVAAADEKPEDKAKLDKEFADKVEKFQKKLKDEKALEGWIFIVPKFTVDALLKDRKDFFADKKADAKAPPAEPPGFPGLQGLPPGLIPDGK